MSDERMLDEFYDARTRSDLPKLLSFVHPDCVFRIVGNEDLPSLAQRWQGLDEITAAADALLATWDMSQVESVETHRCGDTVFVQRRGTIIYRPDGSAIDTEFLDKLTFKDGAIIEYLQFVDTYAIDAFLKQRTAQETA